MMRLLFPLLAFSITAHAQYAGPAVETCRATIDKELKQQNKSIKTVTLEKDNDLVIERYTRKVGSQFVSSVLSGHGAIVREGVPSVEFSFVCLLADEKRAVLFHWTPRRDVPALAQCRRGGAPAACLETLLRVAERDLTEAYAKHYVEGDRDAFRRSAETWKAYRDAECARRNGEDARQACLIELTRRRLHDLQ